MSAHGGPDLIMSGLVMGMDAASVKCYPRSGNTAFDTSGNGFNGTLLNSPIYSTDNGGCFLLGNTYPGANINYSTLLFNTPNLTFNCWFLVNTIGSGYAHFISKELSCKVRIGNTAGQIEVLTSRSGTGWQDVIVTGNVIRPNTWYNTTTTVQSNDSIFTYLNGQVIGSTSIPGTLATNSNVINVGSWHPIGYDPFNGRIAVAHVYNRALSQAEILQNYNVLKSRFQL